MRDHALVAGTSDLSWLLFVHYFSVLRELDALQQSQSCCQFVPVANYGTTTNNYLTGRLKRCLLRFVYSNCKILPESGKAFKKCDEPAGLESKKSRISKRENFSGMCAFHWNKWTQSLNDLDLQYLFS